jgi:glycosyltransferase involved in cell wall biosynthesis
MASETAVLASDVGGMSEQVVDGETGVLLPPGDVNALRGALSSLVNDRDRLRKMGRRGCERLRQEGWTWSEHARQVRELHQAAIGEVSESIIHE